MRCADIKSNRGGAAVRGEADPTPWWHACCSRLAAMAALPSPPFTSTTSEGGGVAMADTERPPLTRRPSWLIARVAADDAYAAQRLSAAGFWRHPRDQTNWIAPERLESARQRDAIALARAAGVPVTAVRGGDAVFECSVHGTQQQQLTRSEASFSPLVRWDGTLLALFVDGLDHPSKGHIPTAALRESSRTHGAEVHEWRRLVERALLRFVTQVIPATARLWLPDWFPASSAAREDLLAIIRSAGVPRKRVILDASVPEPGLVRLARSAFCLGVRIDPELLESRPPRAGEWDFARLSAAPSSLGGARAARALEAFATLEAGVRERIGTPA